MYAEYLRERENKEILQDDRGFAIYGYNCVPGVDFPHVYLQDVFVRPEHRRKGHSRKLTNQVVDQAKDAGFKIMLTSVDSAARASHDSLLAVIGNGFKLFTATGSEIWFSKEL